MNLLDKFIIFSSISLSFGLIGLLIEKELITSRNRYASGLKTGIWPRGIPYAIDKSLDQNIRNGVKQAIAEIESKTCLRFISRANETAFMEFKKGYRCSSPVGYIKSRHRTIFLSNLCRTKGLILHEIVHSLGFMIESNRPDRDEYVKVVWDNIPLDNHRYFKRLDAYSSLARYFRIPYDYQSIMHPSRYWKGNYSVTLLTTDYYQRYKIGQRKKLSELDALSINLLYKCAGATKPPMTIPPDPTKPSPPELKPYLQEKTICGFLTDDVRCRYGYTIWLEQAMYGRRSDTVCTYGRGLQNKCSAAGVFDVVKAKCHGKMECRLHAYNREFGGDPCPGTYKYLETKYRCVKTDTMCFTSGKTIGCPTGQVLKILDATYGRLSRSVCPTIFAKTHQCKSEKSLEITKELCDGKNSCKVLSSHKVYGDPCPGTLKYFQVTHQCVLPGHFKPV